jgi:hypothetical protein
MSDNKHNVQLICDLFFRKRLPGEGIAATCCRLADMLNEYAPPTKHWGPEYIHEVLHRNLPPSKALNSAISKVHSEVIKEDISKFEPVIILVKPGSVLPNSILNGGSRLCSLENCKRPFIPTNSMQIYCSSECRKLAPTCARNHLPKGDKHDGKRK